MPISLQPNSGMNRHESDDITASETALKLVRISNGASHDRKHASLPILHLLDWSVLTVNRDNLSIAGCQLAGNRGP